MKIPSKDQSWPPIGVRDLKPEIVTPGGRLEKMREVLSKAWVIQVKQYDTEPAAADEKQRIQIRSGTEQLFDDFYDDGISPNWERRAVVELDRSLSAGEICAIGIMLMALFIGIFILVTM